MVLQLVRAPKTPDKMTNMRTHDCPSRYDDLLLCFDKERAVCPPTDSACELDTTSNSISVAGALLGPDDARCLVSGKDLETWMVAAWRNRIKV